MRDPKTIAVLTLVVGAALIAVLVIDILISTSTGAALILIGLGVFAAFKNLIPRKLTPIFVVVLAGVLTQLILFVS